MKIMMRESLAGMPRASMTGLLRQSLTLAELDRMFEDDSTESFENLESRLKTPAKKKKKETSNVPPSDEDRRSVTVTPTKNVTECEDLSSKTTVGEEKVERVKEPIPPSATPLQDLEVVGTSLYEIELDEDDTVEGVNASLLVKKAHSYQDLLVMDREEQVLVPATSNSTEDLRIAGSFN